MHPSSKPADESACRMMRRAPRRVVGMISGWWGRALVLMVAVVFDGASAALPAAELASSDHWAFQPLRVVEPPEIDDPPGWARNGIDRFVLASLREQGIAPGREADPRTLLRRLSYGLTGLAPNAEEVDRFVADPSPAAWDDEIERLLASPHYGEHWGRHWLDLVRYADTAGETADYPVPEAWRYRNYVIDSFNRDKPYDRVIREQIAGDLMARDASTPGAYAELVTATGFLAVARRFGFDVRADHYLTLEDVIDTLGKSVLGLSLGCARCHDHKHDPVSTADYYALYGIFESTQFAFPGCEKSKSPEHLVPLLEPARVKAMTDAHSMAMAENLEAVERIRGESSELTRQLRDSAAGADRVLGRGTIDRAGEGTIAGEDGAPISVDVRRGEVVQLSIEPRGDHGADTTLVELEIVVADGGASWSLPEDVLDCFVPDEADPVDGRGGSPWFFLDVRDGPSVLAEWLPAFEGREGLHIRRRGDTPSAFVNASAEPVTAWTTLAARSFFLHPGPEGGVAAAWVCPADLVVRIRGRIADGHPDHGDGVDWVLDHRASSSLGEGLAQLEGLAAEERSATRRSTPAPEAIPVAYAVSEGEAHDAQVQVRGNVEERGESVPRRNLSLLGGQALADPTESGRRELAAWLVDPDNPLTARVMVNRIWHHHFGRGLVATPSDFGTHGAAPEDPDLLDWLARQFIESGWSVRAMHRLILDSATWRVAAASGGNDEATPAFGEAFVRRRLSAEEIRDSLLAVAGRLDPTPGEGHPFPAPSEWGFTQHNPFSADYATERRSVYLMRQRIRRHPFLGLFDGADPNASTAVRDGTTVPTQALFFLNAPEFHAWAESFAGRVIAEGGADSVRAACRIAFQREPGQDERAFFEGLLARCRAEGAGEREAWNSLARILLASNEFLHLD